MAKLLSLESSAEWCSVALSIDGKTTCNVHKQPRQHAQMLLPMVDELLSDEHLSIADLDAIAFGRGPGSFTGIRICMSVVQGLAFGANTPVIPVSTLQALAVAATRAQLISVGESILSAFDARMGEAYYGVYQATAGLPTLIGHERVLSIESLLAETTNTPGILVGSGWQLPVCRDLRDSRDCLSMSITAQDIDVIAQKEFNNGKVVAVEAAEPVYLRNEITWKKRQSIRRSQSQL